MVTRLFVVVIAVGLGLVGLAPTAAVAVGVGVGVGVGQELISQDIARLNKLKRDIESATQTMDQAGVKPWQDAEYAAKWERSLANYEQQFARCASFTQYPEVQAAGAALEQMRNLVQVGLSMGQQQREAGGDVQGRLAQLYQSVANSNPPQVPEPLTADSINAWLVQLATTRQQAEADFNELNQIKQTAHLPNNPGTVESGAPFDMQNVDSMMNVLVRNVQKIDASVEQMASNLNAQMEHVARSLEFYEDLDPSEKQDQANMFLGEGQLEENVAALDKEIVNVQAAVAFDQALGRDTLAQKQALLQRAQFAKTEYITKRARALESARMPAAASSDGELLNIARETLGNPDYEVGNILELVVNSDLRHQSKESSEIEFDEVDVSLSGDITLSGTETTTFFEWDEFQVATAEREGTRCFIYYNTIRKFTRGGTTTPLNRWLVSQRFKGSEILEKNL